MRAFRRAALLLFLLIPAAHAQSDNMQVSTPQPPRGERLQVGEAGLRIHDPEKLPVQLRDMMKKTGCYNESWMKDVPVHIFRAIDNKPRSIVAIAPCGGISLHSQAYLFDRYWMPIPMSFPVIDRPSGIVARFSPGYLQWDAKTKMMTAIESTDICPSRRTKYTYRAGQEFDSQQGPSWILLKAEQTQEMCFDRPEEWQVFWEAPEWKPLTHDRPQ